MKIPLSTLSTNLSFYVLNDVKLPLEPVLPPDVFFLGLKFPTFNSELWSSFRLCYSRHLSLGARAGHRRACRMVGTVVRSVRSNKKYTKSDFILVKANTRNDNPRNPGERLPEPVIAI